MIAIVETASQKPSIKTNGAQKVDAEDEHDDSDEDEEDEDSTVKPDGEAGIHITTELRYTLTF